MNLRNIFIIVYLLLSTVLFLTFSCNLFVWLSFFVSFLIITLITYYHLFIEKEFSPFISAYIVFNYLFFLLAPVIQIGGFEGDDIKYATMMDYKIGLTLKTNALIILFNLVFFASYVYFKKKYRRRIFSVKVKQTDSVLPLTILVLLLMSIFTFFLSYEFILDEFSRPNWLKSSYSVFELLVQKKVLFMVPFAVILLGYQYFKNQNRVSTNSLIIFTILLFSLFLLLWFKNPLTEKRNALGPIYISIIYLFFPRVLNANVKSTSFLFFAMIIIFPLFQILTHIDYSYETISEDPSILMDEFKQAKFVTTFNTLNYDAFSNISATIEYVSKNGLSYGYQLLSGLLFFVPRALWTSKPTSTGELIGNYIIDEYNFIFNNLSNPLVSEGYINFGIFGVILLSLVLAFFIVRLMIWLNKPDQLKRILAFYFAIHLLFLLRGDFTNGYAYYIGTLIGVFLIPKMVHKTIKLALKKQ